VIQRPAAADYPAGSGLPLRVIDDYELVWMLQGRARVLDGDVVAAGGGAGGEPRRVLHPGDLLLVPPGVTHGFAWDEAHPGRHGYVHFGPELFTTTPPTELLVQPTSAHDPLAGLCAYLLWLGQLDGPAWQKPAEATLRFVLRLLVAGPLPPADPRRDLPEPVVVVVDHLREQWAEMPLRRIDVAELADRAAVSRGYLGRLFQEAFGTSPASALERLRCSRAEALLTRTDLPVEVVARECGFADVSHFGHRFAALYDMAPSRYRSRGGSDPSVQSVLDIDMAGRAVTAGRPALRRLASLVWD
jgi:AraC family transcriptional regulator